MTSGTDDLPRHLRGPEACVARAVTLLSIDDVTPIAEVIGDRMLRALDAVHLATAHELRTELTAFVCYDKRLRACAEALGLPVQAPAGA